MTSVAVSTVDSKQEGNHIENLSFKSIVKQIAVRYDDSHFELGKPNLPIETKYEGSFQNGSYHGLGKLIFGDGIIYEGNFVEHRLEGEGKIQWPDGSNYQGEFRNGRRNGKGTFVNKRTQYEGDWKDGKKHGRGCLKFLALDNEYYEGEFEDDKRHGIGKMHYQSGDIYEGEWVNNKRHGKGTLYFTSLFQKYEGEWENGVPSGKGKHYYFNFTTKTCNFYDGQFKNGKRDGFGIFYYADGSRYIGEWSQNLKHGEGEMQSFGGVVKRGMYNMDKLVQSLDEPTTNLKDQVVSLYIDDLIFLSASQQVSVFDPIIEIQDLFARHIHQLKQIFYYYCTVNSQPIRCFVKDSSTSTIQLVQYTLQSNQLSLSQFWNFVNDCGILRNKLQFADVDRVFFVSSFFENKQHRPISRRTTLRSSIKRNVQELPSMINPKIIDAALHHPNNSICFRDFMESIVRLSALLYDDSHLHPKEQQMLSQKVTKLLEQVVLPLASTLTTKEKLLFQHQQKEYQEIFENHTDVLQKIFVAMGAVYQQERVRKLDEGESNVFNEVITMKQYLYMIQKLKLLPTDLSLSQLLNTISNSTDLTREIIFVEFLELLFTTATMIQQNDKIETIKDFVELLVLQAGTRIILPLQK